MIDKDYIVTLVEEYISNTNAFLVEVNIRPGNIIVVEIDSDEGVSIDNCITLSKYIESNLDRDKEDFELEVGSAGITSPFKIPRQYQKNIGNEVEVLTKKGQKVSGILSECNERAFTVVVTKLVKPEGAKRKVPVEEKFSFEYEEVKYTKYQIRFK